jgi:hypothetical protein
MPLSALGSADVRRPARQRCEGAFVHAKARIEMNEADGRLSEPMPSPCKSLILRVEHDVAEADGTNLGVQITTRSGEPLEPGVSNVTVDLHFWSDLADVSHLPSAVDAVVRRMSRSDLGLQVLVSLLACGRLAAAVFVVGRRGDLDAELCEPGADRLDTPTQTLPVGVLVALTDVLVDVAHDQRCGPSSSAAKKADALRKIALARLSSALSRFNRLSSPASSVLTPGRFPASTWACRHHLRTVSGVPTPSSCESWVIAAHSD